MEIEGKYNTAIVFTDHIDEGTQEQIKQLCDQAFAQNSQIRIMPDCHRGAGCVIGTTMTIQETVVPNLVGVDIGCGVLVGRLLKGSQADLPKLDQIIRQRIPCGFNVRTEPYKNDKNLRLETLHAKDQISLDRARCSVGTLGGGNHFIELAQDEDENLYLCIHSGSRYLGKQLADYYQSVASRICRREARKAIVEELKAAHMTHKISEALKTEAGARPLKGLEYLEGEWKDRYLEDTFIVQEYARLNRQVMLEEIVAGMEWQIDETFQTIHNYIDPTDQILRKGAISAKAGEQVIIPLNMRDGSFLAIGKGSPEWNYSAPHGAGRILSRSQARREVSLDLFRNEMRGIYTTSVSEETLDESPMAYKPMEWIQKDIQETVEITTRIKPIYNFKAGN